MSKRYNKIGGLAPDTLRLKNGVTKRYNKIGGLAPDTLRLKNGVTKRYNKIGGLAPDSLRLKNGVTKMNIPVLWLMFKRKKRGEYLYAVLVKVCRSAMKINKLKDYRIHPANASVHPSLYQARKSQNASGRLSYRGLYLWSQPEKSKRS